MEISLEKLADALTPLIASRLMKTPMVWGDASRLVVGANVNLVNTLFNTSSGTITIGDNTFFGHNAHVLTGTHPVEETGRSRHVFPKEGRDIKIGSGVWIATGAIIIGPCSIGDNAVIMAGAVVTPGTYKGNCAYGGIPARLLKELPIK